ncbi:hypothetical protein EYF80_002972 [Liparis tanakae]|uniref:Uncharacterized protein n=1 Tax=Liparis tanakae TaxID=230148 RepID=A0A4Z2J9A4_9TELE|nr:hypothetical protein EYF80_002972 [Liparis tanakae]
MKEDIELTSAWLEAWSTTATDREPRCIRLTGGQEQNCKRAAVQLGVSPKGKEVKTGIANEKVYHVNYIGLSQHVAAWRMELALGRVPLAWCLKMEEESSSRVQPSRPKMVDGPEDEPESPLLVTADPQNLHGCLQLGKQLGGPLLILRLSMVCKAAAEPDDDGLILSSGQQVPIGSLGHAVNPTFSEYIEGALMGLTTTMLGPAWVCTRLPPYRCLKECITLDSFKYCREARSSTRSNISGFAWSSK